MTILIIQLNNNSTRVCQLSDLSSELFMDKDEVPAVNQLRSWTWVFYFQNSNNLGESNYITE